MGGRTARRSDTISNRDAYTTSRLGAQRSTPSHPSKGTLALGSFVHLPNLSLLSVNEN